MARRAPRATPGLVVVESDEDVLLYDTGHIPGAVKVDWHTDLNDPVTRDYVDGARLRRAAAASAASAATPRSSSTATRTTGGPPTRCGCSQLFGHEDVRLLDGGRAKWVAEGRELTTRGARARRRSTTRSSSATTRRSAPSRTTCSRTSAQPLVDVRSPGEYSGELLHMPDYPQEGALRGGHIPGAQSVPWARAAAEDGTFKPRAELEAIYLERAGPDARTTTSSPTAASASARSHTWFVLTHLLGFEQRAQLRRLVDRVGQHRAGADRPQGQPVTRRP